MLGRAGERGGAGKRLERKGRGERLEGKPLKRWGQEEDKAGSKYFLLNELEFLL